MRSMTKVNMIRLIVVCCALIWTSATALLPRSLAQSPTQKSQSADRPLAMKAFHLYTVLEQKQEYGRIYDLLSNGYKEQLKREEKVDGAKAYERLRLSSEARWSQFRVVKTDAADDGRFRLLVEVRGEESGIVETDSRFYYIVMDGGKWKIDRWVLVSASNPKADKQGRLDRLCAQFARSLS